MNTWRMNGSLALAVSPSEELLVGTVRQPRSVCPSDWTICSKTLAPAGGAWSGCAAGTPGRCRTRPGPGSVEARPFSPPAERRRAASASARPRRRRCWPRNRRRRDGRGCAAPGWPAAGCGGISGPSCRRRSRRRRPRARTTDRRVPASWLPQGAARVALLSAACVLHTQFPLLYSKAYFAHASAFASRRFCVKNWLERVRAATLTRDLCRGVACAAVDRQSRLDDNGIRCWVNVNLASIDR